MTRVDLAVLGTDGTVGGPGGSPLSGGGGAGGGTGNVTDRGAWATATAYNLHDIVSYGGTTWRCTFAHTSTTTFDDTKWAELDQHRGAWQANVRYEAGDTVISSGVLYSAITAFTSSGSFNAANWNVVGGTSATANVTDRGAWAASTVYNAHDLVEYGGTDFLCAVAHTSGAAFDTTKWTELSQFRGAWQASTVYEAGDIVAQGGSLYSANINFTSGASFSATNWTQISGGGGGGAAILWKAGQWYVDHANGSDSTGTGTSALPFATISKAVSSAGAGDVIWIAVATYQENVYITKQITLLAFGNPGANTSTSGVEVKAPNNWSDCITLSGAGANQSRLVGIGTVGLGAAWTGWGIRGAGASYVVVDNWNHYGGGTPTKTGGGGAIAVGHGEQWTVNGAPHISGASQGIVLGVEGDEHYIENPHLSSCYQELYVGPYETFRSPLTASVTNSATTWPINNSSDLPASGIGFTQDLMAPPAAPVPTTSASGGTILAGVYQVEVTYANAAGETVASVSGSVTTTGSTSTITVPSPPAAQGATGWYAYVTQLGGSTYTRQQAFGSPTAIGTSLTLSAPPTSTGTQPLTVGSAFSAEAIAWTGNTANSLTGVTRAVVGALASNIGATGTLTVFLPSPGNAISNGLLNPFLVNNLPSSGTVQIDSEQISYTALTNIGNGSYTLAGTVTRGANGTTAASHSQNAPVSDHAAVSAVAHASAVPVIMYAGASGFSGAWSGGYTIKQFKSASCQPQTPWDAVVDIHTGGSLEQADFSESGNANTPRFRQSCTGLKLVKPTFAPQSTITDDGTQTSYEMPSGGNVILSALSKSCVVENNLGTTFTNNGTGNRFAALRWNAGTLSFTVTGVDAASMGDQKVPFLDQASGLLKWMSVLGIPAGAAANDLFYYNGTALTRLPIGSNGQFLEVVAGAPAWGSALTAPAGAVAGDLFYWNGSGLVRIPVGSNGQVLSVVTGLPAWNNVASGAASTSVITASNAAWPIPAGATMLEIVCLGGGGGGGGGGSPSTAVTQDGGAGGGAGGAAQAVFPVGTNTTLNVAIGASGTAGTGGASGGNAGITGGLGGASSVAGNTSGISLGAPGGSGGSASTAGQTNQSVPGGAPATTVANARTNVISGSQGQSPGFGGSGNGGTTGAGTGGGPSGYMPGGGGGCAQSSTTNGGNGGGAGGAGAGGSYGTGTTATANGAAGTSAAANSGGGGGGGGGGATGGAGGNGGAGGSGVVIVKVVG